MIRRLHRDETRDEQEAKLDLDMLQAAGQGEEESLKQLLSHGGRVTATTSKQQTPLHIAAMTGYLPSVQLLLDNGASLEAKNWVGHTALYYAAANGHMSVVSYFSTAVQKKANPTEGWTFIGPIFGAAINGHHHVVRFLLDRGGFADFMDGDAGEALYHAARLGSHGVSKLLFDTETIIGTEKKFGSRFDKVLMRRVLHGLFNVADIIGLQMTFSRGADGSPLCVAKRTLLKLLPNKGAKPKSEQTYARNHGMRLL
jgi:ankyrin repeat protein